MNITLEGEMPKSSAKGGVKTSQIINGLAAPNPKKKKAAKPKTKKK